MIIILQDQNKKYLKKRDLFKQNLPKNASVIEFGSGSNKKSKKIIRGFK